MFVYIYQISQTAFKPLLSYCQEQFFYTTIKPFYLGRFYPKMGFIFKRVQKFFMCTYRILVKMFVPILEKIGSVIFSTALSTVIKK